MMSLLTLIEKNIRTRQSFSSKMKMEMLICTFYLSKRTAGRSRTKDNADMHDTVLRHMPSF